MDISALIFINLWEECIAGSAVQNCIEVRLAGCAICRSQSLLSLLLVALWQIIGVRAAVHVEVVRIASQWSPAIFSFLNLLVRSLLISRLVKHFTDHSSERGLICGRGSRSVIGVRSAVSGVVV